MKYVFEDINTLIAHIVQSYEYDELSPIKLQGGLYLAYAYYTKYYNIIKYDELNTPQNLFDAGFVADKEGLIIDDSLNKLFHNEDSYDRTVKRLLKHHIKKLYKVDERILKNVDNVMITIVDELNDEQVMSRVRSDYSWIHAFNNNKSINLNHISHEYNYKDEVKIMTDKDVVDYNAIL